MNRMSEERSIEAPPPVSPHRMHGGRPVLEPHASHAWESGVVLNPAAVLLEDGRMLRRLARLWGLSDAEIARLEDAGGACVMLYRAQGEVDRSLRHAPSSIGLAILTPDLELVKRHPAPVLRPDARFQNLGVEDPRCTRVGDAFYLYYTGYGRRHAGSGRPAICLATTKDFLGWTLAGPMNGDVNRFPSKNAALLPEPVDGKWLLLHRPMEGPDAMTIHFAESDAPDGPWHSRGRLMESHPYREFATSWIGAGGPPIALGGGRFLMIYHQGHFTQDRRREYDLAAALLDFSFEDPVRARIEPLMRPEIDQELAGDPNLGVDNVLFTCANYVKSSATTEHDDIIIPYGGADSRIFGASISKTGLLESLEALAAP